MKVTPEFIVSFETELRGLVTSNWDRVIAALSWDRIMKTRPSSTKREILTWLLETARLYPAGNGGNVRFDDMVAATHSYENEDIAGGLRLTRNEIEDNQLKDTPSVGALDYAAKWAKDMGAAAAYFPQQELFKLIKAGKTKKSYDGVAYFSASHPVNPNGGGPTYSNLVTAVPINPTSGATEAENLGLAQKNFAKAIAAVSGQRFFNGVPRHLKASVVVAPTALQYRVKQLTGGKILGATENVITGYGFEDPIIAAELDEEPDVYYLGVEDVLADELGAFVFSEREAFTMRGYTGLEEAALNRQDLFEWTMKGRNTAIFGHPYLFYRCEPT